MVEEGFAWPGTMCTASDSHAPMYGALGCLGVSVVRTDAAVIYATGTIPSPCYRTLQFSNKLGRTWWECPPIARVNLTGVLPPGITGKDVIVALCSVFKDDVANHCVEFTGSEETMRSLPIDTRLTVGGLHQDSFES